MTNKSVNPRECYPSHGLPVLDRRWRPFLLAVLLMLAGCGESVRFTDKPKEGPVVILGDSLAEAYQLPKEDGFVSVLSERTDLDIVNLGRNGATTADSLPRVAEEVLPLKPSLVILELGGNDALQRVDIETTRANLQSMIDQIQATETPILLLGVRGGLLNDKFAQMFEDLAESNKLAYVPDILEGILTSPSLRIDNVHPNAEGYKKIADRIEPELRRLKEKLEL